MGEARAVSWSPPPGWLERVKRPEFWAWVAGALHAIPLPLFVTAYHYHERHFGSTTLIVTATTVGVIANSLAGLAWLVIGFRWCADLLEDRTGMTIPEVEAALADPV